MAQETYDALRDEIVAREVDEIQIGSRESIVTAYELVGFLEDR